MKPEGLSIIVNSSELTPGEKKYIVDFQYRMGGSFTRALFDAITHADESNLAQLALGFPDEVQGYLAWTRGDLYERASRIVGGDVGSIESKPKDTAVPSDE